MTRPAKGTRSVARGNGRKKYNTAVQPGLVSMVNAIANVETISGYSISYADTPISVSSTVDVWIDIGYDPHASANKFYLKANRVVEFIVAAGMYLSVLPVSSSGYGTVYTHGTIQTDGGAFGFSQGTFYEPETIAWAQYATLNDIDEIGVFNDFVLAMKAAGLWAKMLYFNYFSPKSFAAALKDCVGLTTGTAQGGLSSSNFSGTGGTFVGDGAAYIDTGLFADTIGVSSSSGSLHTAQSDASPQGCAIGSWGLAFNRFYIIYDEVGGNLGGYMKQELTGSTNFPAYLELSKRVADELNLFEKANVVATSNDTLGSLPHCKVCVGARGISDKFSVDNVLTGGINFAAVGLSFDQTDIDNFISATEEFMTNLGRP